MTVIIEEMVVQTKLIDNTYDDIEKEERLSSLERDISQLKKDFIKEKIKNQKK